MYTACFKRKEKKNDKIEVSVMLLLAIVEYFIVL